MASPQPSLNGVAGTVDAFPSIDNFRKAFPKFIKDAQFTYYDRKTKTAHYDRFATLPHLEFRGTVKLHGSNTGIVQTISAQGETTIHFQSRNRIITMEHDLVGFVAHMSGKDETRAIENILSYLRDYRLVSLKQPEKISIFGEWCGEKIQKGVALSKLPKLYVIYAIKVEYRAARAALKTNEACQQEWFDFSTSSDIITDPKARIFNIHQFKAWALDVEFNDFKSVEIAEKTVEALTREVENQCPVGKRFGVDGTGEGLVWQVTRVRGPLAHKFAHCTEPKFWFKSKGEKHADSSEGKSKTKTPTAMGTASEERLKGILDLVLTPERLEQGVQFIEREKMLPLQMSSFGVFLHWIIGDVRKEESDRMEEVGVPEKRMTKAITAAAKAWFIGRLERGKVERGDRQILEIKEAHRLEKDVLLLRSEDAKP